MASTLISLEDLRDHLETGLVDDALEQLVDDIDTDIIRLFGPHDGELTIKTRPGSFMKMAVLPRPAASVASISHRHDLHTDETSIEVEDYELIHGGRALHKRWGFWHQNVTVTFTPVEDNKRRVQVLVDVARLELQFTGVLRQQTGSYTEWTLDLVKERNRILGRLRQPYAGAGMLV